jgi:hypothetical protein
MGSVVTLHGRIVITSAVTICIIGIVCIFFLMFRLMLSLFLPMVLMFFSLNSQPVLLLHVLLLWMRVISGILSG